MALSLNLLTSKSGFTLTRVTTMIIETIRKTRTWIIIFTLVDIMTIIAVAFKSGIAFAVKPITSILACCFDMAGVRLSRTFIGIFRCSSCSKCSCLFGSSCFPNRLYRLLSGRRTPTLAIVRSFGPTTELTILKFGNAL